MPLHYYSFSPLLLSSFSLNFHYYLIRQWILFIVFWLQMPLFHFAINIDHFLHTLYSMMPFSHYATPLFHYFHISSPFHWLSIFSLRWLSLIFSFIIDIFIHIIYSIISRFSFPLHDYAIAYYAIIIHFFSLLDRLLRHIIIFFTPLFSPTFHFLHYLHIIIRYIITPLLSLILSFSFIIDSRIFHTFLHQIIDYFLIRLIFTFSFHYFHYIDIIFIFIIINYFQTLLFLHYYISFIIFSSLIDTEFHQLHYFHYFLSSSLFIFFIHFIFIIFSLLIIYYFHLLLLLSFSVSDIFHIADIYLPLHWLFRFFFH